MASSDFRSALRAALPYPDLPLPMTLLGSALQPSSSPRPSEAMIMLFRKAFDPTVFQLPHGGIPGAVGTSLFVSLPHVCSLLFLWCQGAADSL